MPGQELEQIVGAAARDQLAHVEDGVHGNAARTQAAVVSSLVDQLERHFESCACASHLGDQVTEEFGRLSQLIRGLSPAATVPSFASAFIVVEEHHGR